MRTIRTLRWELIKRATVALVATVFLWTSAFLIARTGPTLLFADAETLGLYGGICAFPECAYNDMLIPGRTIDAGDFISRFWGGLPGADGDVLVVWGRAGLALARCSAPGSQYGGYIKGWFTVRAGWILSALLLIVGGTSWLSCRRPRRSRRYCARCGYSLRGLINPRCPECGMPFRADPERVRESHTKCV
jgi:hypothetical protein